MFPSITINPVDYENNTSAKSSSESMEILTSSHKPVTHKRILVHMSFILYSSEDFLMPVMTYSRSRLERCLQNMNRAFTNINIPCMLNKLKKLDHQGKKECLQFSKKKERERMLAIDLFYLSLAQADMAF